MRALLAVLLVSLPAAAQLSGTLTATPVGTRSVRLTLELQCGCSPAEYSASDVTWRYSALDAGAQPFVTPTLDGGHFEFVGALPQVGTALTFSVAEASCACGATDSGVVSVTAAPFVALPVFETPSFIDPTEGGLVIVHGFPQGDEHVEFTYFGAGIDGGLDITHTGADFTGGQTTVVLHPTQEGELTLTATLAPWSATTSTALVVEHVTQKTEPGGCATAPGLLVAMAVALARRKPRRSTTSAHSR